MARPRLIGPDHFGGLLAIIVASTLVTPLFDGHRSRGLVGGLLAGVLLVGALVASGIRTHVVVVVGCLTVALVGLTSAGAIVQDEGAAWVYMVITAMVASTPFLVLRRVLSHREVTLATVAGALCAYLLVGIAFGALYETLSVLDETNFSQPLHGAATYFSFVTLTTLGYGDITATSDLARSFVMLEAVTGQVLLVTLVARFVTTLGQVRTVGSPRAGDTDPDEPA